MNWWIKYNIDGSYVNSLASCGGIFRNESWNFLFAFSDLVDENSSLHVELFGVIKAIHFSFSLGFAKVWLETKSKWLFLRLKTQRLCLETYKLDDLMIWQKLEIWSFSSLTFYMEGNHCTNKLASMTTNVEPHVVFHYSPSFLASSLYHDKLGLPSFRFIFIGA